MAFSILANTLYNFSAIWLDSERNLLEVAEPQVTILHFENDLKVYDVQNAAMTRMSKGIYRYPLILDTSIFSVDLDYLVIYRAVDIRDMQEAFMEDSFQIVYPASSDGLNISTVR